MVRLVVPSPRRAGPESRQADPARPFLLLGLATAPAFAAAVLLGGRLAPAYSHLADPVSALTQAGAPHRLGPALLFSLSALGLGALGWGVARRAGPGDRRLRWSGRLLAGCGAVALLLATVLPQDPIGAPATLRGLLHIGLVALSALALVVAILLAGRALDPPGARRGAWPASLATVAVMALGGLGVPVALALHWPLLGLCERVTQGAYLLWLLALDLRLLRDGPRRAAPLEDAAALRPRAPAAAAAHP